MLTSVTYRFYVPEPYSLYSSGDRIHVWTFLIISVHGHPIPNQNLVYIRYTTFRHPVKNLLALQQAAALMTMAWSTIMAGIPVRTAYPSTVYTTISSTVRVPAVRTLGIARYEYRYRVLVGDTSTVLTVYSLRPVQ